MTERKVTTNTTQRNGDSNVGRKTYAQVVSSQAPVWREKRGKEDEVPKKDERSSQPMNGTNDSFNEVLKNMQSLFEVQGNMERRVVVLEDLFHQLKSKIDAWFEAREENVGDGSSNGVHAGEKIRVEDEDDVGSTVPESAEEKSEYVHIETGANNPEGEDFIATSENGGVLKEGPQCDMVSDEEDIANRDGADFGTGTKLRKRGEVKELFLLSKPSSLRYNHLGANLGLSMLSRKKKAFVTLSAKEQYDQHDSDSLTESVEPEVGTEFKNRHNRAMDETNRLEAEKTVEVGKSVGVYFEPNDSSAIEKLMNM